MPSAATDASVGRRRAGRGTLAALAALACAGCGVLHTDTATVGPARPLTVALNGQASAAYAPLYLGAADGAFARGALRVSLAAASSDSGALAALATGRAQVAIASEPAVLAARANGQRIVAIGALESGPLEALISLRALGAPKALAGKRLVTDGSGLAAAEVTSYLKQTGGTAYPARLVRGNARSLIDHTAYAMLGRLDLDGPTLALAHQHPSVVPVSQMGVPTYTDLAIVVRVGTARYQGALLRAFLQSLTRAATATRANPGAAAQALVRANPTLPLRFELAALSATRSVMQPQQGEPFGFQDPVAWQSFGEWLAARGLLRSAAVAGDTVTDEYLPGQGE
jgi:putative hydroxymethylpyrimidine transport system substrate-binding protein